MTSSGGVNRRTRPSRSDPELASLAWSARYPAAVASNWGLTRTARSPSTADAVATASSRLVTPLMIAAPLAAISVAASSDERADAGKQLAWSAVIIGHSCAVIAL